jgi:hypothetical protein
MRIFVFILVLVNGLFFAFAQTQSQPNNPDAQRLKQQVEPERIRILKSVPESSGG